MSADTPDPRGPAPEAVRGRNVTAGDLATGEVVSIAPDRPLREAARTMDERGVGSIVVFEEDALVGILTERDLMRTMADGVDPDAATVKEHMTTEVVTAGADWEVYEAAAEMTDQHIRHLVVTGGGDVLGVLSVRDVLLAGQRVELTNGSWAVLRDPLTLTVRERRRLQRILLQLSGGSTADLDLDPVIAEMVGSWSFDAATDADAVAALDDADRELLRTAVEEDLPALQRAVHPAPGWRHWRD